MQRRRWVGEPLPLEFRKAINIKISIEYKEAIFRQRFNISTIAEWLEAAHTQLQELNSYNLNDFSKNNYMGGDTTWAKQNTLISFTIYDGNNV